MKIKPNSRLAFPLASAIGALFAGQSAQAQTTWDGGSGVDNNWGTGANWVGDAAPTPGTAADLIFAGTTRLAPVFNYANGDDFRDITFAAGAGAFTIANTGTLALADNAQIMFVLDAISGSNNSNSGAGTVTLEGDFVIDTSVASGVMADCQTDTDLVGPWTSATGAPGVVIQVHDNYASFTPPAANTDRVCVYVPRGANPKLFGRLNVVVP